MSAALRRPSEPTPFTSPERAALAAAIVKAVAADVRRAALAKAVTTADADVRAARRAVEATTEAVETAKVNAITHARDQAMGVVGEAPVSVREARAAAIAAADDLETARETHEALAAEMAAEKGRPDFAKMLVEKRAKSVICGEMQQRAVALAAEVACLQRELVQKGSGLQWLHSAGVFLTEERGADDLIAHTIQRLDLAPSQWAIGTIRYTTSFAEPTGCLAWETAFEALKRDATTPLPVDLA